MKPFNLGSQVSLEDLISVAQGRSVTLSPSASGKAASSRRQLERIIASGQAVYGVNTGFGELASRRIEANSIRQLQYNLLRSHACGVGEPLSPEASRAILLLRANELARGYSGCRPELVRTLVLILNHGLAPMIPSRGSVGASGDLAPQAHAGLLIIGEGEARIFRNGRWSALMSGARVLKAAGLKPLKLEAKEGLSLINGTQAMQAVGGLALVGALNVLESAHLAAAMSLESIRGTPVPFEETVAALKPHPGQKRVAARMRELLKNSEIRESHRADDPRVQDPYSFRCVPQVHGAVSDALDFAAKAVETEMASVTDNPVIIGSRVVSAGNFHGQALAFAYDAAAIALASLAGISERRTAQLISGTHGLPPFLAGNPGLESGFMIPQVAAAALASELKTLAHPASADSIPTSAGKEDFVSMGMGAALKLKMAVDLAAQVVAIELVTGSHAVEMLKPLKPGRGVAQGLETLRSKVRRLKGDASISENLCAAKALVLSGAFSSRSRRDGR